jgi:phage baseplate assembly protein gpV
MERFFNHLKAQSAILDQAVGQPRFGIVSSVDPARYVVKVRFQPEDVLSGWLPVLVPWIGQNWGMFCLPTPGAQVLVLPQEGEAEHGVVLGGAYGGSNQPPEGGVAGEFWLIHRTGTALRFRNDGSVEGEAAMWRLKGDLHIDGDVYDRHGSMATLRGHYNVHRHTDSHGGLTTPADQQD